ncbi:MAG TPA: hypothetical protein DCF91_14235 [Porphyromonadaceae bacterium]|nr:hypothetical protein [Porphyromonadaceae bacterium]
MRLKLYHKLNLTATIIMVAVSAFGQGINLSLWKGISTQTNDSTKSSYFNLGVYSNFYKLNGFGANILASNVRSDINGIQISGISNIVEGSMHGIQAAGICNITGNNASGAIVSGLTNITGNNTSGFVFSGLTNIIGNNSSSLTMAGIMNIAGETANGVHIAGVANIAGTTFNGAMVGGLLNIAAKDLNGIQLSAFANIAGEQMNGLQMGLANYSTNGRGLQIGLVNYYREQFDGFQLGLVNANPNTKVQLMMFGGNNAKVNLAVRFKNELFYTLLGTGMYYFDFKDKFSESFFYRAGMWHTIYKNLSISGDLGYQHIEGFKSTDKRRPKRLYALQARINLEYQITDKIGVFGTGGYGIDRFYSHNATYRKRPIVEAGIILF